MKRIIRRFSQFILLLCAYALFLIVSVPARHAYGLIQQQTPFIKPASIEGTVWSALVTDVQIGAIAFKRAEIALLPVPLLSGTVAAKLSMSDKDKQITGQITRLNANTLLLNDVKAYFQAAEINRWLRAYKPITGNMNLQLQQIKISGPPWHIQSIQGSVVWSQALIQELVPIELGSVRAEFKAANKGKSTEIKAMLSNSQSPHKLQGEVSLSPAGNYQINVFLTPDADINPRLLALLQSQGRTDSRGQIHYRMQGNL